jgi:3-deoxy-D-manno-octulosonic-acid transferase
MKVTGRTAYTLALRAAAPFILMRLWWRGRREPAYRERIGERFGRYAGRPAKNLVWVHAVSVGEARAAAPLVRALKHALPDHELLLTCTTAAGRETLRQVYGETVTAAYLPYDFPGAVQRFLEHFRPRLGLLMETEIWPNLLAACARHGVPVALANARMSAQSAAGYARWPSLTGPAFRGLAAVLAQSADDADRLRALGASRVSVAGNLKFDVAPDPGLMEAGRAWRARLGRPVLLLASTREGEESLLLDTLGTADARLLVVIVPRHPRRFEEAAQWADARRSETQFPGESTRIYLGDTMGEMAFYYAACDVAVVGGSFAPLGGQNLIEALAAGAPVITGPHMFNFTEATRLACEAGAALQAPDAKAALRAALGLLADGERRARMAQAGKAVCEMHRGATARHVAACLELLATAPARG